MMSSVLDIRYDRSQNYKLGKVKDWGTKTLHRKTTEFRAISGGGKLESSREPGRIPHSARGGYVR